MEKKYRVLVVDDDFMIAKFLYEILRKEYDVKTVNSGHEAIQVLHDFYPDVVILDVMMPGMNGYEVCRYIRSDQQLCKLKVIFLTAKLIIDDKIEGYNAGGDDYLVKPFDKAELLAKVRVFSRLKHEEDKRPVDLVSDKNTLRLLYEISENISDILYIQANSPYCKIVRCESKHKYQLRAKIKVIEDYFHGRGLIRVHRSYLVNSNKIESVTQEQYRDYKLKLECANKDVEVPVGRSYYTKIKPYLPENS